MEVGSYDIVLKNFLHSEARIEPSLVLTGHLDREYRHKEDLPNHQNLVPKIRELKKVEVSKKIQTEKF